MTNPTRNARRLYRSKRSSSLIFELEIIPIDGIFDELRVDAFLTSDLKRIYVDQFAMQHRRRRYRFSLRHEVSAFTTNFTSDCMRSRKLNLSAIGKAYRPPSRKTHTRGSNTKRTASRASCLHRAMNCAMSSRSGIRAARDAGMSDATVERSWQDLPRELARRSIRLLRKTLSNVGWTKIICGRRPTSRDRLLKGDPASVALTIAG